MGSILHAKQSAKKPVMSLALQRVGFRPIGGGFGDSCVEGTLLGRHNVANLGESGRGEECGDRSELVSGGRLEVRVETELSWGEAALE